MSLIERTAISEYTLAGQPIRAGQVAALTPLQVRTLAAAGCVALSDEENALVSTSGLPPQESAGRPEAEGYAAAVATARRQAEADLAAINRSVEEARAAASAEAAALEEGLASRRQAAADEIAQIDARVKAARAAEAASAGTGAAATTDTAGTSTAKKAR